MWRLGDLVNTRKTANRGGVCKVLSCQKSMYGRWRGGRARARCRVWDFGNGTIMLRTETKPYKSRSNSPTVAKEFENKFGQVVEKLSDVILCLFGFVKATKFRDSNEYLLCVQNALARSCLPC